MKNIFKDIKILLNSFKGQGVIFYFGCAYIIFSYLRPQLIYPQLNFLPWLQLTIVIGLVLIILKKQLYLTAAHALVFLFAILCLVSALNSYYPEISMRNVDTPFIWALEVLFLSNCISNIKQFKLIVGLLFLCLFKMAFFGAKTWTMRGFGFTEWGIQGPPGFFQNSGEYSLIMAMLAIMSIPYILSMSIKRSYLWILPLTASMSVLGASSRGSQLALAIGIIYLLIAYKKFNIKYIIYAAIFTSLVLAILPKEQKLRFSQMGDDKTSTSRLTYWKAGIDMTAKNPWTGVGIFAFPDYYSDYYRDSDGREGFLANRKEVSHNSLIQVGSTIGIPALFMYLILHFRIIFLKPLPKNIKNTTSAYKDISYYTVMLRGGTITFFIGSLFMSVAFYPYIYLLTSLSIALAQTSKKPTI